MDLNCYYIGLDSCFTRTYLFWIVVLHRLICWVHRHLLSYCHYTGLLCGFLIVITWVWIIVFTQACLQGYYHYTGLPYGILIVVT